MFVLILIFFITKSNYLKWFFQRDATVDYDEIAWELEKCLVYHFISTRSQVVMNEEASMSRRGTEPLSRKTKTPGKKKAAYCVYLAYQLIVSRLLTAHWQFLELRVYSVVF